MPNVKKSGALTYPDPLGPSRQPVVGETFTFTAYSKLWISYRIQTVASSMVCHPQYRYYYCLQSSSLQSSTRPPVCTCFCYLNGRCIPLRFPCFKYTYPLALQPFFQINTQSLPFVICLYCAHQLYNVSRTSTTAWLLHTYIQT